MKILLIGEFSGVHNNLKKGLVSLGHEVRLAADGDDFKRFNSDITLNPFRGKYVGRILNLVYFIFILPKLIGYDVIQFVSPFSIKRYIQRLGLFSLLFKYNKISVYYSCGTDPNYLTSRKKLEYFPFNNDKTYSPVILKFHDWFLENITAIVPATYSYSIGYKKNPKRKNQIKLPGSGTYINAHKRNSHKKKILVGITRKEFKGMEFILPAVNRVKVMFCDLVEVKVVEKLPFSEYEKLLKEFDIIVDQCKSYSYGMNAIFGMERGLIVLSGNEEESNDYSRVSNNVVINIKPSIDDIYSKIVELIFLSEEEIYKLKIKSIDYVRKNHDPEIIANQFINQYNKLLRN